MAQIQDRKSNFYSQKQSIRDESSAPQYLESAGDVLIKNLAKKQLRTSTTLEEQLQVVQNFEKGFELNPDDKKGIASLEDFKKNSWEEDATSSESAKLEEPRDLDELMRITGLTRHELEISLCEKPNSTISQLYKFAIKNEKQKERSECLKLKLPDHPINQLKEIEKEYFGHLRGESSRESPIKQAKEEKKKPKKKHRKRKKKIRDDNEQAPASKKSQVSKSPAVEEEKVVESPASSSRVSLWDVKDMKKWKEGKAKGCQPRALYTIKDGKIIKLEKDPGSEDIT